MATLQDIEAELVRIDEVRRVTINLAVAMREYDQVVGRKVGADGNGAVREQSTPSASVRSQSMRDTEAAAITLMDARNGPVQVPDVVEEMRRRGIELPERKPTNVISARLSNNPRFKGRRGHGYWYADRPWPGLEDSASHDDDDADENGALHGDAESAPEAGEGATSPIENRPGLRLIG